MCLTAVQRVSFDHVRGPHGTPKPPLRQPKLSRAGTPEEVHEASDLVEIAAPKRLTAFFKNRAERDYFGILR